MNVISVQTPEKVIVEFKIAGLARRFFAYIIDFLIILAIDGVLVLFISATAIFGSFAMAIAVLSFFLVNHGYFIALEYYGRGQTPGKKAMKIRVRRCNGTQIGFYEAFIRNVCRFIDIQPAFFILGPGFYLVGIISIFTTRHGTRLGDLVAGTVVISEEKVNIPTRELAADAKYNSFLEDNGLMARIRNNITPLEKEALVELVIRRSELAPDNKHSVFKEYAAYFKEKLRIRQDKFLSDERLVLNIAQIVLRDE